MFCNKYCSTTRSYRNMLSCAFKFFIFLSFFHFSIQWNIPSLGQISSKIQNKYVSKLSATTITTIISALTIIAPWNSNANADFSASPWNSNIQYEIVKSFPDADQPKVGEIVAIRFKGEYKGNEFDNTFKTDAPYFYRCGVGLVVKGVDDTVVNMHVGDRYRLKFGGDLAFGEKGKPSAPGKPRIPPNAEVNYEIELVELPGKGEDFIADYE